ncbi:MAG: hypothetical protein GXO55_07900 [Chloroflexi bacterium]|nr:hypothetical protein [Chloroflexota bacterium]
MNEERPGCLSGLLKLTLLSAFFVWTEEKFGFGKGCSCTGCGCGLILLFLFILLLCGILFGTDWTHLSVLPR